MLRSIFLFFVLSTTLAASIIFLLIFPRVATPVIQFVMNRVLNDSFGASIKIEEARLDKSLQFDARNVKAVLKTHAGKLPIEVGRIYSQDAVWKLLSNNGLEFTFKHAKCSNSIYEGLNGNARIRLGKHSFVEIQSDVLGVGIEDFIWLSPESLSGSHGKLNGILAVRTDGSTSPTFGLDVKAGAQDTYLRAEFLGMLLAYAPQVIDPAVIQKIASRGGLIKIRNGSLSMDLNEPDRLKIFLKMLVLEYNLDLNLKIEVRVDQTNGFFELFKILSKLGNGSS